MNYIVITIELILFVAAVIIAILSWKTATKSLREAEKARRDMFLPIIVSKPDSSQFSGKYVWFFIQNVGHGVALRPKYRMLGIKDRHIIEGYLSSATNIREKKSLDFLDHRVSQGFHYLAFDLTTTNFNVLKDSKLKLEILYNDVFTRHIKTTYELTLVKQDQYHIFQLDNLQVHLP